MHRTDSDVQRRVYLIVAILALGTLLSLVVTSGLAQASTPPALRMFRALVYPAVIIALAWVTLHLIGKKTISDHMGRTLVGVVTLYFLGDMALSLLTHTGPLAQLHYEAHYWKLLVLCLSWPVVLPPRWGVVAIGSVACLSAAIQIVSVYRSLPVELVMSGMVTLLISHLKFTGALVLVLYLAFTKKQRRQVDQEIQTMRRLAQTDPLTDVWNRRRLHAAFDEAIEQGCDPLTVILFDIDSFKEINDAHGHNMGDRVLITTTHLAQRALRAQDTIGRWGGEEFIILCPGTTLGQGMQIAERIREAISSHMFDGVGTITASFGVAQYRQGESVEELVHRADQVLYVAKERGKNCVEAAALHEPVAT